MRNILIGIFILNLIVVSVNAVTLDQTYDHIVYSNGTSVVSRTSDLEIFSGALTPEMSAQVDLACRNNNVANCQFNRQTKKITITRSFNNLNEYYETRTKNEFPFTRYTLKIKKIPTDKLADVIAKILKAANINSENAEGVMAVDLSENRSESAKYLKQSDVKIQYNVQMPAGEKTTFDVVDVLLEPHEINIDSKELNGSEIFLILGLIVVIGLGIAFWSNQTQGLSKAKDAPKQLKKIKNAKRRE